MSSDTDVRSVVRALSIFDAFDAQYSSLSLQEIGVKVEVPKATAFRLVNTLVNTGFLVRLPDSRYALAPKMARLGSLVRSNLGIRDVVYPTMLAVNEATRETVTLNVAAGQHRLCVEVVDTPSPLMAIVRAGEQAPLGYGATGRILLATMPEDQRNQILAEMKLGEEARSAIERELSRFRLQGYSLTRNQRVQGVTAIAVPLTDPSSGGHYCLALTGPSIRMDPAESAHIDLMVRAGADINRALGGASAVPVKATPVRKTAATKKPVKNNGT